MRVGMEEMEGREMKGERDNEEGRAKKEGEGRRWKEERYEGGEMGEKNSEASVGTKNIDGGEVKETRKVQEERECWEKMEKRYSSEK